jgi:hypothetical protein
MDAPTPICLDFAVSTDAKVRARIMYAFRVFAAIYNYRVVDPHTVSGALRCYYGQAGESRGKAWDLIIAARYRLNLPLQSTTKLSKHRYANEDFWLAYGVEETTGNPDWLGEIFEWITCSHEINVRQRDSIGRIPYAETLFARQGISFQKPYAAMLMAWLENELRRTGAGEALVKAQSPIEGVDHVVVCTHDLDYYYTNRKAAFIRHAKNLVIAVRPYQSWSYFSSNVRLMFEVLKGRRIWDYLPQLLKESDECRFQSTVFVVCRTGHRRDPNYKLHQMETHLHDARRKGFSVAVHGSYTSVIGGNTLTSEGKALAQIVPSGLPGNRQHYLRFDQHARLYDEIQKAGFLFDSTLGFPDRAGFRNGASFAFPPYDFRKEQSHQFLEIPLALMDGNVEATSRINRQSPQQVADDVLTQSRNYGWGGIAALWHNPLEAIHVPEAVNQVFWTCTKQQARFNERWMSAPQFLSQCLHRYHNAGLLQSVQLDA